MSTNNDDSDRHDEAEAPVIVSFEDVSAAAYRIRKGIKKTPCEVSGNRYIDPREKLSHIIT